MKKFIYSLILILFFYFIYNSGNSSICLGSECIKDDISMDSMSSVQIIEEVRLRNAIILDIRENDEWVTGHITGAIHIPLLQLNKESTKGFEKDREIYVYCRSGRRAETAKNILKEIGFKNVANLGGVIKWQEIGGELITD